MASPDQYSLGPLPWTDETLVSAVWRNSREAREWVGEHPGRDLDDRLNSLRAVLRIFERSSRQFEETLVRFHDEAHGGHLFRRNRKNDLEAYEEHFSELLYVFASSAMTLVDQARAMSQKVALPGYSEHVRTAFSSNPQHRFIQELRVDLVHVTLHRPGWQLTSGRDEESTSKFMLWPIQLKRATEYNAHARQFIRDHAAGIDLGGLIADYRAQVRQFHEWLHDAVNAAAGAIIADY